jgi:DNA-binding response OmpR family regulator
MLRRRVLVIDDDIDIRTLLELVFEQAGFAVITAANGEEGLRAARLARPAVIVLDLMMPVMDGFEFRRRQRGDPALCGIPLVVTSACHNLQRRTSALDAMAVFEKPLDLDALVETVIEASQMT